MCFDEVSLKTLAYLFFTLIFKESISGSNYFLIDWHWKNSRQRGFLKCCGDLLCQMTKELWIRSLWSHRLPKYHPRSLFLQARLTAYWERGFCTQNVRINQFCHHLYPGQCNLNHIHQMYFIFLHVFLGWKGCKDKFCPTPASVLFLQVCIDVNF